MYFKRMEIKNVGPFANFEVNMTRGSIGIFGRNGVGKSTLTNLMYALVTGDFGRFDGIRTDMIRGNAEPKATAYVSGVISHNGADIEITRNLRVSKTRPNTLVKHGNETIADAGKGQATIDTLLGVSKKLLDTYVFKQQHEVYDFLTSTAAERARAYQVLCRTESCEELWNMLGSFLTRDREVITEIDDDSDTLLQASAVLKQEREDLLKQREELSQSVLDAKTFQSCTEMIEQAEVAGDLAAQIKASVLQCKTYRADVEKMQAALDATIADHNCVAASLDNDRNEAKRDEATLRAIENYTKIATRRTELVAALKQTQEKLSTLKEPRPLKESASLAELLAEHTDLNRRVTAAKATLKVFEDTGRTNCPTCGTDVSELTPHLDACRDLYTSAGTLSRKLQERIAALESHAVAIEQYQKAKATTQTRIATYNAELAGLAQGNPVVGDIKAIRARLDLFEAEEAKFKAEATAIIEKQNQISAKTGKLEAERQRLIKLRERANKVKFNPDSLEKVKELLASHGVAVLQIAQLDGQLKGLNREIKDKADTLARLRARLDRSTKVRDMARIITKARDVLHRDRLPQRVARINLARMEGDINKNLEQFDDPFWVEAAEDLSFIVHKPNEQPHAASRLSTGQRVILALAFWPAVISLWGKELGMLVLDEPTANLDTDNRKLLGHAITAMTAKVRGERQLIMVTHDHDLRSAFDQVIDLGG